jgi:hemoglobin-like flavoprotein
VEEAWNTNTCRVRLIGSGFATCLRGENAMDIRESLKRILQRKQPVIASFYEVFFDEYPEVRPFFAGVNMKRQAVLLTMAIQLIVQYYSYSFPVMEGYLKILGEKHRDRGIGKEHFPKFALAMLETLRRFHGPEWDEQLAQQWHEALELASATMLEAYADSE